ncbi:autotransporter outer membrane beta-barrel domain-containing protein [Pseudomonas entomophila]|uniref:autotransporter family protein n=1 Tax=Pseudomonas entomophila TaxID=312306 RepID=UPI002405CF6C|nr:autotransporter outer membrane beta-barrel domain-containing protein [Pseudomonas entomophila]MDF9616646.1 autotransporter outer membrane beta-barrel domain-containing protein [Pseudomonas entomophila]
MPAPTFRKTLLALAITTGPLPALAVPAPQTITLTDAGYSSQHQTYGDDLKFTGSFSDIGRTAIDLANAKVLGDLVVDSAINATKGNTYSLTTRVDGIRIADSALAGYFYNRGIVKTTSAGGSALKISATTLDGDLVNEGLLQAGGDLSYALVDAPKFGIDLASRNGGRTVINGDLINANGARIASNGTQSRGINLAGASLEGRVINHGEIHVVGPSAIGIDATTGSVLAGVTNNGLLYIGAQESIGINLDGTTLVGSLDSHVVNTGKITAGNIAIKVGNVAYDGPGLQPQYKANGDLNIFNSGTIWSQVAVDATTSNRPVELIMREGSNILGDLNGLANIEVEGNASFGANYPDQGNIRLRNGGWLEIGSADEPPITFSLSSLHTNLVGNLRVADHSSLGMELGDETNPATPVLKVSGIAEFGQDARIALAPDDEDYLPAGGRYLLLEAGQVQVLDANGQAVDPNGKPKVVSTSALLNVRSSTLEGNKVYVEVNTKSEEAIDQMVQEQGGDSNAQHALNGLAGSGLLAFLGKDDPLLRIASQADEAQLTRLAEQLAPDVSDGARQAASASQRLITNITLNRTSGLRGVASGDTLKDTGVWVQTLYSDATQQHRDGIAGYNAYSRGIAVGADGKLDDQLTLGLAYSFINTDVNGRSGSKTEVEGHAFTLYGGYELGNYFIDGNLTYGFNDNEGKRDIAGTRAKSDYDSKQLGLNLIAGYTWQASSQWLVEPRLAARYNRVDIDGYKEKGSSAALKLEDQRYEAIELGAGVRLAGSYALGAGTLEPQFKLMTYHDFAADKVQNTSTFLVGGTPFVTNGASTARNSYEAGVGADYKLGAVTVGLNYDYVGKSGFDADVFSAKVRYDF